MPAESLSRSTCLLVLARPFILLRPLIYLHDIIEVCHLWPTPLIALGFRFTNNQQIYDNGCDFLEVPVCNEGSGMEAWASQFNRSVYRAYHISHLRNLMLLLRKHLLEEHDFVAASRLLSVLATSFRERISTEEVDPPVLVSDVVFHAGVEALRHLDQTVPYRPMIQFFQNLIIADAQHVRFLSITSLSFAFNSNYYRYRTKETRDHSRVVFLSHAKGNVQRSLRYA